MITISTSMGEAETAVSELKALTVQVLESNQVLAERMANLELQHSAYALSQAPNSMQEDYNHHDHYRKAGLISRRASILYDGETSTDSLILAPKIDVEDQDNESMVTVGRIGPITTESLSVVDGFAFEQELLASRPYARAINRRPCLSATSSVVPTMGWSYLSGLSLAHVSAVSMLSLPLSALELWNGHRYVTARNDLQASEGDKEQQEKASIEPIINIETPLDEATSKDNKEQQKQTSVPRTKNMQNLGNLLYRRDDAALIFGTTYINKVIVPSNTASSLTDREKECLFRAKAHFINTYSYCMDIAFLSLTVYTPVIPSFTTSSKRP